MKIVFGLLIVVAVACSGNAQNYLINWHTIDGGGGTSTGSVYSVSGSIGQPDAGATMTNTNGQFTVTGGFWALAQVVQTEGAPTLSLTPTAPGFATISWTPNTLDFVLQETPSLSPPSWTNSPSGSMNPVTLSTTNNARFFRLHKP